MLIKYWDYTRILLKKIINLKENSIFQYNKKKKKKKKKL